MMTDMFLQIDNSKAGKYAFALTLILQSKRRESITLK